MTANKVLLLLPLCCRGLLSFSSGRNTDQLHMLDNQSPGVCVQHMKPVGRVVTERSSV